MDKNQKIVDEVHSTIWAWAHMEAEKLKLAPAAKAEFVDAECKLAVDKVRTGGK